MEEFRYFLGLLLLVISTAFKTAINNVHSISTTASLATRSLFSLDPVWEQSNTDFALLFGEPPVNDIAVVHPKCVPADFNYTVSGFSGSHDWFLAHTEVCAPVEVLSATGFGFPKGGIMVSQQREQLAKAVKKARKAIFNARTWRILVGRLLATLGDWIYTFAFSLGYIADPEVILALDQLRHQMLNRFRRDAGCGSYRRHRRDKRGIRRQARSRNGVPGSVPDPHLDSMDLPLVLHSHHGYGKHLAFGGCLIIVEDYDTGLIMHYDMMETIFEGHLVHCVYPGELGDHEDAVFHFAFTRRRRICIRLENYDEWYVLDATASDRLDDSPRTIHAAFDYIINIDEQRVR